MSNEPSLLPVLPFNEVDEAVRLLDSTSEPCSIQLELQVSGRLDEPRLRAALGQAMARHPMTRARQVSSRATDRRYHWEITSEPDLDPLRVVECPDDDALAAARAELQSLSVPLTESPPLRARLARHPGGDRVMLNVNHAAFDGYGCLDVLRSTARAYAGVEDPLPDVELAAARHIRSHLAARNLRTRARRLAALAERLWNLAVAPARIAPEQGSDRPGYGFHHTSLSQEQTEALSSQHHPGTVNDVLVAALNLAIAEWNTDHGAPTGRISVLLPMNFRPREWQQEMAVNYALMSWLSTTATDRRSPEATLKAVTTQTEKIKKTGTGAAFFELLALSPRLPLWVKQSFYRLLGLTGNRLVDTVLLSNLGKLDKPPSFGPDAGETTETWFSAPARMPCGLSLGVATVAGRLHLVFRYRHPLFGPDAASRFAERYLAELGRLVPAAASSAGQTVRWFAPRAGGPRGARRGSQVALRAGSPRRSRARR